MNTETKRSWLKPGIESKGVGCLCCSATTSMLELDTKFYDGFGGWVVTKNGEEFYRDTSDDWDNVKDVSDIEEMIGEDEESEYLAILWSPLRGATYQRHSKNHWALIEQNEGFA